MIIKGLLMWFNYVIVWNICEKEECGSLLDVLGSFLDCCLE